LKKILGFSVLLLAGLAGSQLLSLMGPELEHATREGVRVLTMVFLGFIMIHVGYEFEIDKSRLKSYAVDNGVALTAAAFPWIFCTLYFLAFMMPEGALASFGAWKEALMAGLFAAPTSAGVLFSMLAAAGLSATWMFRKARVLAIFDDLNTVLLLIPLKMMVVGLRWQLWAVVLVMALLLWVSYRYLRRLRAPARWRWVLGYSAAIVLVSEVVYFASRIVDEVVPIHIEVLLPAFVLGTLLVRPSDPHVDDSREGHQEGPESPQEQRVSTIVSAVFMVLVGLSMPRLELRGGEVSTSLLLMHTLVITVLANLGKMFPLLSYRDVHLKERLALCIGMWPRGEVGAGILVLALRFDIGKPIVAVAALSLALNLLCTGLFIVWVRRILREVPRGTSRPI